MTSVSPYAHADWKIRFLTATFVFPSEPTSFTISAVKDIIDQLAKVEKIDIKDGKKLGVHVVFENYTTVKNIIYFVEELARLTNCIAAYMRFYAPMYFGGAKMTPFRVPIVIANWEKGTLQLDIMTMRMFEMMEKLHASDDPSCVLATLMEAHTKDTNPLILRAERIIPTSQDAAHRRLYEATLVAAAALGKSGISVDEEKLQEALKPLILEEN